MASPLIGKQVEVGIKDRLETIERGELVSLDATGVAIKFVSRGNEHTIWYPLANIAYVKVSQAVAAEVK